MRMREALVKVTSEDMAVEKIDHIEADYGELRVYMKDGSTVFFTLSERVEKHEL